MEIHLYNVESAYLPLTDAESSRNNVQMALKLNSHMLLYCSFHCLIDYFTLFMQISIFYLSESQQGPTNSEREMFAANSKKMTISEQSEQLEFSYATSEKSEHGTVLNKTFLLLQLIVRTPFFFNSECPQFGLQTLEFDGLRSYTVFLDQFEIIVYTSKIQKSICLIICLQF